MRSHTAGFRLGTRLPEARDLQCPLCKLFHLLSVAQAGVHHAQSKLRTRTKLDSRCKLMSSACKLSSEDQSETAP